MAPQLLDYRLFMLLTNMIWAELFNLISPDRVNLDFALLFNLRNFSVYASMLAPCGRIAEGYSEMEDCHFSRKHFSDKTAPKFHDFRIKKFLKKVKLFFQTRNRYIDGKRNMELDRDFMQIWDEYIPEPHRSDIQRAHNLRQLFRYQSCVMFYRRTWVLNNDRWRESHKFDRYLG
jgi:hypothetical protein